MVKCIQCLSWVLILILIDRLGRLVPEDAPSVIDAVLETPARPMGSYDPPMLLQHWRGRIGLSKDEQLQLYNSVIPQAGETAS